MYFVYIVRCEDDTLYTGIAADIERRLREHFTQSEKCAKYTRSRRIAFLEALWTAENRSFASRLECRIKRCTRKQKLELISAPEKIAELAENCGTVAPAEKYTLPMNCSDGL